MNLEAITFGTAVFDLDLPLMDEISRWHQRFLYWNDEGRYFLGLDGDELFLNWNWKSGLGCFLRLRFDNLASLDLLNSVNVDGLKGTFSFLCFPPSLGMVDGSSQSISWGASSFSFSCLFSCSWIQFQHPWQSCRVRTWQRQGSPGDLSELIVNSSLLITYWFHPYLLCLDILEWTGGLKSPRISIKGSVRFSNVLRDFVIMRTLYKTTLSSNLMVILVWSSWDACTATANFLNRSSQQLRLFSEVLVMVIHLEFQNGPSHICRKFCSHRIVGIYSVNIL